MLLLNKIQASNSNLTVNALGPIPNPQVRHFFYVVSDFTSTAFFGMISISITRNNHKFDIYFLIINFYCSYFSPHPSAHNSRWVVMFTVCHFIYEMELIVFILQWIFLFSLFFSEMKNDLNISLLRHHQFHSEFDGSGWGMICSRKHFSNFLVLLANPRQCCHCRRAI